MTFEPDLHLWREVSRHGGAGLVSLVLLDERGKVQHRWVPMSAGEQQQVTLAEDMLIIAGHPLEGLHAAAVKEVFGE